MKHKDRDYGMQETVKKVSFKFKEFHFVLLLQEAAKNGEELMGR